MNSPQEEELLELIEKYNEDKYCTNMNWTIFLGDHENEKEANEKFKSILEDCQRSKSAFIDKEFPHEPKSYMTFDEQSKVYGKYESWKTWLFPKIWRRITPPSTDVSSSLSVYNPLTFTAYEVFQRKVGDCGLVAALSAISTKPEVIMNIFDSLQLSKYGVYKVKLFVDGQWKTIIIDDYFPYTTDGIRIGATSGYQIWAALIEKALVKECGNYKGIHGFQSLSAFSALTGSPVLLIPVAKMFNNLRKYWKTLMEFRNNQYPMACGTLNREVNGILPQHAYTIMDIVERDGHKLLLLRNPSGGSVWTRNWSKEWEWWPENMKDLLEGMIRGSFWISWDDFLNVFCSIYVCRHRSNWFAYYAKLVLKYPEDDAFPAIDIKVTEKCMVCISAVDDWISREVLLKTVEFQMPKYVQRYSWIAVHKINGIFSDNKKVVACEIINDSTQDIDLEPGIYTITVIYLNDWSLDKRDISIHSSRPISVNEGFSRTRKDSVHIKYIVDKFGQEIVKEQKDKMSIKKYTDNNFTFIAVVAWNFTYDQFLHAHLRYSITDEQFVSRSLEDKQTVDVIPPRRHQVLVVINLEAMPEIVDFPIDIDYKLSKDVDATINGIKRGCHLPEISSSRFLEYVHREEIISLDDFIPEIEVLSKLN
ncbi:Calpain catalytic domain-containing protein [Caenorhabditis elegans]|uniref:Calpain catalytic domain-containing protein n=1 Tax=Caenorhabditis elegans TaxID=6239 RepID=O02260_CAEEL|nr:Calpain catalytic domain-containing protein [Caenorhabditis elegans]CAB03101.3 Calpain catalytic domain-containing protein [Caenorhabditis elegans]|eukprot:NP_493327.2 CaLPain family [Caenorhabditis elegans]